MNFRVVAYITPFLSDIFQTTILCIFPLLSHFLRKHHVNKLPHILEKNVKQVYKADFPIIAYITPFLSAIFQDNAIIFSSISYYPIFRGNTM